MRNVLVLLLSLVLACLPMSAQTTIQKVPAPVALPKSGAVISPTTPLPDLVISSCRVEYVPNGCAANPSGKFLLFRKLKNIGRKELVAQPNQELVKWWATDADGNSNGSLTGGGWVFYAPAGGLLLNPGQEISFAPDCDWSCVVGKKAGTYSYTYVADPNNKFVEKDKGNNTTTLSYVVTPEMVGTPAVFDLAVVSVVAKPATGPAATTRFAFDVIVKNVGTGEAPEFGARSELGGVGYYSAKLPAGQTATVSVPPLGYNVAPGSKTIWCEVFVTASGVTEANKTNNKGSVTFIATQ
jgi:hypothetical protein